MISIEQSNKVETCIEALKLLDQAVHNLPKTDPQFWNHRIVSWCLHKSISGLDLSYDKIVITSEIFEEKPYCHYVDYARTLSIKGILNDQQERHTGSNIGGTDIREVSKGEVKREEEV